MENTVWPKHDGGLLVTHNEHRTLCEHIVDAIMRENDDNSDMCTYPAESFPDEAEIAKAIALDSVWKIQWYPEAFVGFRSVCAATFERALEMTKAAP